MEAASFELRASSALIEITLYIVAYFIFETARSSKLVARSFSLAAFLQPFASPE